MDTELLIRAEWLVPMDGANRVLPQHAIAVDNGRISAIIPAADYQQINPQTSITLKNHVVMPGLINSHTHAAMSLMRGLADDLPLMSWLQEHIWPAEQQQVNQNFVEDGTRLAIAEMLQSGTTCFNDMYFFPQAAAQVAEKSGMRASIGLIVVEFPSPWAQSTDEYFRKGLEVRDRFRGNPLIQCCFAPHAPYTVNDSTLKRIRTLSDELDLPVHMHLHETAHEIQESLQQYNLRPLQRLQSLQLATPSLLAVHMTQVSDGDLELLADTGVHVVHCPESNLKLASGFCPLDRLLQAGVNVALGTDGAASNNDLDMFAEMRTAALLAKGVSQRADALPALSALEMATINAATALGMEDEIGSLQVGKSADLIAVDLGQLQSQPVYDPVSQLVYACGREQVRHVWIAGEHLLSDGRLTRMDVEQLLDDTHAWQQKLQQHHH